MLGIIVAVAVGALALILVGVGVYNGIVGAQCKKIEEKEISEKETALQKKKGTYVEPTQETEEPTEETNQEVEEKEEPVEEKVEEPKEEPTEEKTEEVKEEKVEEVKEEKPAKKAPTKKAEKKEKPAKKVEEVKEENDSDAEDLLKDVPDAKDNVEEKAEEPKEEVKEEPTEEKVEEVKEEKPAKKAPVKKAEKKEKPVVEKEALPRKAPAKKATPIEKDMADGKWILIADTDGYYYAELKANNGQLLLTTEKYKGINGIKSGIETIKKNLEKDNYEISVDKNNTANFKLFGSNASLLCIGEGYTTKENAESAINSVKNFSTSPVIVSEEVDSTEIKKYEIAEAEKNDGGKWIIVDTKDGYLHAELKANNGQVLLVTENYKGINSLTSGLESIRKNIANGNFGTKRDKNDNYNFKLFSENKRLLALGAGYSSLASCESAINSVMRFSSSPIIDNAEN